MGTRFPHTFTADPGNGRIVMKREYPDEVPSNSLEMRPNFVAILSEPDEAGIRLITGAIWFNEDHLWTVLTLAGKEGIFIPELSPDQDTGKGCWLALEGGRSIRISYENPRQPLVHLGVASMDHGIGMVSMDVEGNTQNLLLTSREFLRALSPGLRLDPKYQPHN